MDRPPANRIRFRWDSADLAATLERLRRSGFAVSPAGVVDFPSLRIDIAAAETPADVLVQQPDDDTLAGSVAHPNRIADVVGVGWATVDLDRLTSGGGEARYEQARYVQARDEPHLGAYARLGTGAAARIQPVLLEPNTEGRLAATLARHGEGPAALYLRAGPGGLAALGSAVRGLGGLTSTIQDGPLGRSVLLIGGSLTGPHLIAVEAPSDASGDPAAPGTIGP